MSDSLSTVTSSLTVKDEAKDTIAISLLHLQAINLVSLIADGRR
jgi:hypothetical protein